MNCFSASDFSFSFNSVTVFITSLPNNLSNNSLSKSAGSLEFISLIVKTTSILRLSETSLSNFKYVTRSFFSLKRPLVFKLIISPDLAPINFFKFDLPFNLSSEKVAVESIPSLSLKNCPVISSFSSALSLEISLPYCFWILIIWLLIDLSSAVIL